MKKIIIALMLAMVVVLSGCTTFTSKLDNASLRDAVKTAVSDEYLTGEIKGLLSTGTFQSFCCYKVGNTVVASARYYDLAEEATNIPCFQLPAGFWPREKTTCNGYIYVNGSSKPVFLNINTDGVVSIAYSNIDKMTQVFFSATFPA